MGPMKRDVLVLGSGPAGMAAAAACRGVGLDVQLVAPAPRANWTPTYSAWSDELPAWVRRDMCWNEVQVHLGDNDVVRVDRPYARIDREALHGELWARAHGITLTDARAAVSKVSEAGVVVSDDGGGEHHAAVVVDATGSNDATHFQTAYGLIAEVSGSGAERLDAESPLWMDFSESFGSGREIPTFLYALPNSDGTWLLEETALIRGPLVPYSELERRLWIRLGRMGIDVDRVVGVERCTIPMDVAPRRARGVVRFGTAGGMVHPATGFHVARVLSAAPRLASAIASGLSEGPDAAVARAHAAVWPDDSARRHGLFRFGAKAMAGLSTTHTRAFFRAFFSMPDPFVRGFLAGSLPTAEMVAGMTSMFARLPLSVRWRLLHPGSAAELARAAMTRSQPVVTESLVESTP